MKQLILTAPGRLRFEEVEQPTVQGPDEILVRVACASIGPGDLRAYLEGPDKPCVPGSAAVGVVVDMGKNLSTVEPGDHVALRPPDGEPPVGAMQEYLLLDRRYWHKIPKSLPFETAVFLQDYAAAFEALAVGGVENRDVLLIQSRGADGLAMLDVAERCGAACILADSSSARRERARRLGALLVVDPENEDLRERVTAFTGGEGPNVIIDPDSLPEALRGYVEMVSQAGRIVLGPGAGTAAYEMKTVTYKELDIVACRTGRRSFAKSIGYSLEYMDRAGLLIDESCRFEEAARAFSQASRRLGDGSGTVIRFGEGEQA